jgi:hypothetical protein
MVGGDPRASSFQRAVRDFYKKDPFFHLGKHPIENHPELEAYLCSNDWNLPDSANLVLLHPDGNWALHYRNLSVSAAVYRMTAVLIKAIVADAPFKETVQTINALDRSVGAQKDKIPIGLDDETYESIFAAALAPLPILSQYQSSIFSVHQATLCTAAFAMTHENTEFLIKPADLLQLPKAMYAEAVFWGWYTTRKTHPQLVTQATVCRGFPDPAPMIQIVQMKKSRLISWQDAYDRLIANMESDAARWEKLSQRPEYE